ncbi:MAG: hypothetical protein ACM3S4_12215 [Burkholderiales bacterium]
MNEVKKLKCFINEKWRESAADTYMDIYDPSRGAPKSTHGTAR